jgi:hypothetical protein
MRKTYVSFLGFLLTPDPEIGLSPTFFLKRSVDPATH